MEPHYWSTYNIFQLLLILQMIRKNGGWYSPSLQAQGLRLGPLGMSAALISAGLAYNIIERESLRLTNLMHDSHVQSSGKPVQACVRLGSCSARIILCAPYSCFSSPAKAVEVAAPVLTAVLPVATTNGMMKESAESAQKVATSLLHRFLRQMHQGTARLILSVPSCPLTFRFCLFRCSENVSPCHRHGCPWPPEWPPW